MKKLYRILLLAGWLFATPACSDSEVDRADILSLSQTAVSINKQGLTYEGGTVTFEVTSNVYWIIHTDDDADWLSVSPRAAQGSRTVTIEAQANAGARRTTTLRFESRDGMTAEIEVSQGSGSETIYYLKTGAGSQPTVEEIAVGDFSAWDTEGVGVQELRITGQNAFVSAYEASAGYDGATGWNNILLRKSDDTAADEECSAAIENIRTQGGSSFRLKFGVRMPEKGTADSFRVKLGNENEYVALPCTFDAAPGEWVEAQSIFYLEAATEQLNLRFESSASGWRIDDIRLYEGTPGEGDEIAFSVGGDDGQEIGFVYFEDDFSWVTEALFGGTDYIGLWPNASGETGWSTVTVATKGQEAYDTLVESGWTLGDNPLKLRTYLRSGYVKFGRAANAAGAGGSLKTPQLPIRKNCAVTIRVSFDCCDFFSTGGKFDAAAAMQVRIDGDGTIDDGTTSRTFQLSTTSAMQAIWLSGDPAKNPWEHKEFIIRGATASTRIIFESVEETAVNRWFLDNVRIEKVNPDATSQVDPIQLDVPAPHADEQAATETSVRFAWPAVANAAAYEYASVCIYCGQEDPSRSGTVEGTAIEFTELEPGTSVRIRVRALPAADDPTFSTSEWSAYATAATYVEITDPEPTETYETIFEDDFSWITEAFGGTDYIGGFPDATGENWWNNITPTKVDEATYQTLVNSGWTLGDNALKQRTYMRVGYVKMGRGKNNAGAGGSLMTPTMPIAEGTQATLRVAFDCCVYVSKAISFDPGKMQVRIKGDGMIEGSESGTVLELPMSTSEETAAIWGSADPARSPWERKEIVVNGATASTQIIFESVEETAANRWFLDNVKVERKVN